MRWIALFVALMLVVQREAAAQVVVFEDRQSFNDALDAMPELTKTVEGWDALPVGTQILQGSTVNGITYTRCPGSACTVTDRFPPLSAPHTLGRLPNDLFDGTDRAEFAFSAPIRAFGISMYNQRVDELGGFQLLIDDGNPFGFSGYDPFPGGSVGHFMGFISVDELLSVRVVGRNGGIATCSTI